MQRRRRMHACARAQADEAFVGAFLEAAFSRIQRANELAQRLAQMQLRAAQATPATAPADPQQQQQQQGPGKATSGGADADAGAPSAASSSSSEVLRSFLGSLVDEELAEWYDAQEGFTLGGLADLLRGCAAMGARPTDPEVGRCLPCLRVRSGTQPKVAAIIVVLSLCLRLCLCPKRVDLGAKEEGGGNLLLWHFGPAAVRRDGMGSLDFCAAIAQARAATHAWALHMC